MSLGIKTAVEGVSLNRCWYLTAVRPQSPPSLFPLSLFQLSLTQPY